MYPFILVADKWLEGALRDLGGGQFKSRVNPFVRQWGTSNY
jgi:hypothetical protein